MRVCVWLMFAEFREGMVPVWPPRYRPLLVIGVVMSELMTGDKETGI